MSVQDRNDAQPLAYGTMRGKLEPDDTDGKPAVLTIKTAERRNFGPKGQAAEWKIVLTFEEFDEEKELVCNSTDYRTLAAKLGEDESQWVGKPCAVAPTTTRYGGKTFEKTHVVAPDRWDKLVKSSKSK